MTLTFVSPPRIGLAQFQWILERYRSPIAPIARQCYTIITRHGLDPAVALAFCAKESVFITRGRSVRWKSWGNVRTPFKRELATYRAGYPGGMEPQPHGQSFAVYDSIPKSLEDWCLRIKRRYIAQQGLHTVDQALPVYAPPSDGNDTMLYLRQVYGWVADWMEADAETHLYRVVPWRVNVRKTPSTADKIITKLGGEEVFAGRLTTGMALDDDNRWIERAAGGYVHASLVEVV